MPFTDRERRMILRSLALQYGNFEDWRAKGGDPDATDDAVLAQTESFEAVRDIVRKLGGDPDLPAFGAERDTS